MDETRDYPRTIALGDRSYELSLLTSDDAQAILDLAAELPRHDLLFLRRDITRPAEVERWIAELESGLVTTVLARRDGRPVGYGTLHRSELPWSSHVAELRVVVIPDERGRGLGRALTQELFALALTKGIEKMVARMTVDQKGAIATFEGLGFRPEALLRDHVKDLDGKSHDLIVMSHAVAELDGTLRAYGVAENLQSP